MRPSSRSLLVRACHFFTVSRYRALNSDPVGMIVGLTLRLTSSTFIQSVVSFDYQFFFNLLLPPIILASGYELHQVQRFIVMTEIGGSANGLFRRTSFEILEQS